MSSITLSKQPVPRCNFLKDSLGIGFSYVCSDNFRLQYCQIPHPEVEKILTVVGTREMAMKELVQSFKHKEAMSRLSEENTVMVRKKQKAENESREP